MHTNRKRLKKGALVAACAGTLAILGTGLVPVAAQIIGDPLGLISIGTSPSDNPSATVLAVSPGGSASASTGAGVSTTGSASGGLVAASGTGCASNGSTFATAPVAASATGCASGGGTAVSGTGTACGTGVVGLSVTSDSCGFVATSGTGRAAGTYSVDHDGEVTAEGQQISVFTGAQLAVTDPSQVQDPNYVLANTVSATEAATKEQNVALIMPVVDEDLVTMAGLPVAASGARATSSCNPDGGGCPGPYKVLSGTSSPSAPGGWWFEQWQQHDYTCAPAATNEIVSNLYNEPDTESQIAGLEKTSSDNGTSFKNIPPAANDLYKSHGAGFNYFSSSDVGTDTTKLMGLATWDIWYGPHSDGRGNGIILDVKPDTLSWWQKAGYHSPAGHYFSAFGYDHSGKGRLDIFDQFNYHALTGRSASTDPVYGEHWATLAELSASMSKGAPFGEVIW